MKIIKTATVNAPIDRVWELLGPEYARAGDWASGVYASRARDGDPKVAGAPVAGRVCQTSLGPFTESIEAYSERAHHVGYSAKGEKMPGFMKGLRNDWHLTAAGPNRTEVRMEMQADIAFPFSFLMGPMMRLQFGKVLRESLEEFVHFAETGQPHPRKARVDRTRKAVAARASFA